MVDFPCDDESICVCVWERGKNPRLYPPYFVAFSPYNYVQTSLTFSLSLSLSLPPPPLFPLWVIFSHNTYCLDFHHSVFNTVGKYHTLDLRVPWPLPFFFDMLLRHKLPVRLIWQKNCDAIYVNFPFCG